MENDYGCIKQHEEDLPGGYPKKSNMGKDRVWPLIEISVAVDFLGTNIYMYTIDVKNIDLQIKDIKKHG